MKYTLIIPLALSFALPAYAMEKMIEILDDFQNQLKIRREIDRKLEDLKLQDLNIFAGRHLYERIVVPLKNPVYKTLSTELDTAHQLDSDRVNRLKDELIQYFKRYQRRNASKNNKIRLSS